MAQLLAQGQGIWPYLNRYKTFDPTWYVYQGKREIAHPFTQFGEPGAAGAFLFISDYMGGYGSVYYINNELWQDQNQFLFRNGVYLQAFINAGYKVKWVVPVYKALIAFGLQLVPGGKWIGRAMSLATLAQFWNAHKPEIDQCIDVTKALVDDLRAMYEKCPKLTKTMILIAMGEVAADFRQEIRDKGIMEVITSRLDGETYMETIAIFVGAVFKASLDHPGSSGGVGGWLTEKGFKRLGKVAKVYKKISKPLSLMTKGAAVARGPGIKDAHLAPTAFLQEFSKENIPLLPVQFDCNALQKEGCLSNEATLRRLDNIEKNSEQLHVLMKDLTEKAELEIF